MIPVKLFDQVSQAGHFAAGLAVVWGFAVFFNAPLVGILLLAGFVAAKEFWWDRNYETDLVRGNSWKDALFYLLGAGVAELALILKTAL